MALGRIGMVFRNQRLDHGDHLANIPCRPWHMRRLERPHLGHVVQIPLRRLPRDLANAAPALGGACVDLVVHIGEVAHIGDMVRPIDMAQQTIERIKHNYRPRIADMRTVIDCWPTDIHPHIVSVDRLKELFPAGLGVVQLYLGHGRPSYAQMRSSGGLNNLHNEME